MAKQRTIDVDELTVQKAKETAIFLTKGSNTPDIIKILSSENLEDVEKGIKKLNEYSATCWLLSALALYTLVYDKEMYQQSGLDWLTYMSETKKRTGLSRREVTEQLSSARFFIKNYDKLAKAGWNPIESSRKLARAELALELSGNLNDTIKHIVNDTWLEFKNWYQSFKTLSLPSNNQKKNIFKADEIKIKNQKVMLRGNPVLTLSENLSSEERAKLDNYIRQIFYALKDGNEPAIIPVADELEARRLITLRDKERQNV